MISYFFSLFSIQVYHPYYDGICRDFDFVVPPETMQLLNRGRIIVKEADNRLHCLYEWAEDEAMDIAPLSTLTSGIVRVGLKLNNPYFLNFTDVEPDFLTALHIYRAAAPSTLADPVKATPVSPMFSHELDETRPLTVTLSDPSGAVVHTEVITDPDRKTVSYDLRNRPGGMYTVQESLPGRQPVRYYLDETFRQQGVNLVVEIPVNGIFYVPSSYQIAFQVKNERLRYYVATRFYSLDDINLLEATDVGYGDDTRPQVVFEKVPEGELTEMEPVYAQSHLPGDAVVLFRSTGEVPRQARPRKGLQLSSDGEVLITNLPHPGPDNAGSHIITRIVKLPV